MNTHSTISASMVYVALLALVANGWVTKLRKFVAAKSGVK